ncbi:MAG: hypothetical protein ACJ74T_21700 [Pyrinomonadaceae bacterium]
MTNRFFALALALLFTLAPATTAAAKTTPAPADWSAVQSLSAGQKIIVRTKDGDRLTGTFDSATDLLITFTDDGKKVSLTRESIQLVQLNRSKSRLNGGLLGAAIGGGAALAIGGWVYSQGGGDFNGLVVYGPGLVGAGIGAGVGAALGKGNKNETIYEAQ